MGRTEEIYKASVRFSVGVENTAAEIDDAVERIAGVVKRLRESVPVAWVLQVSAGKMGPGREHG